MDQAIQNAAERLWKAAQTGTPCEPVRDLIGADNVDAAYAVQKIISARRESLGARLVGRKIGLTSKSVQKQLGVDQPDYGALFAHMAYGDGETVPWQHLMQPKIEAEVALVLERDLPEPGITVAEMIRAVAFALPALEIVGSRIAAWNIRFVDAEPTLSLLRSYGG